MADKKKYLTPQGFGRKQERLRLQQERAEDFIFQQKGYRIEYIGPFKRWESPQGEVWIEANANVPAAKKALEKQEKEIKKMKKLAKKSHFA